MKRIAITGAAGNLGVLTTRYLLKHTNCELNLLIHKKSLPQDISENPRVKVFTCDLEKKESIGKSFEDVSALLHYASVLFKAHPERFMPITNTKFFENTVLAAKEAGVERVILTSFPHVEGVTTVSSPSTDWLNGNPDSVHAQTRLAEEKFLYSVYPDGIILRMGMVYGKGILMPDAARWFAKRRLLGVWRTPTWIHLISRDDYLEVARNALLKPGIKGTYNIGDEGQQTLQDYLDFACRQWNCSPPWRMPEWMIYSAARIFEVTSQVFNIPSPLTKDFLDIGRTSYYGDTTRMRSELLPVLKYPTMQDGIEIF